MAEVLLSSEAFIKSQMNISDNVAGKYILPSLREAQEVHLRNIIGSSLLTKLKDLVRSKNVTEPYETLLDKCQNFLAYSTIVELIYKVSFKIGNAGVVKATDENMQVATMAEIVSQKEYYQGKADYYCLMMQQYLLDNRSLFPELNDGTCQKIHSNLYSAATCGFFLGGARGKKRR